VGEWTVRKSYQTHTHTHTHTHIAHTHTHTHTHTHIAHTHIAHTHTHTHTLHTHTHTRTHTHCTHTHTPSPPSLLAPSPLVQPRPPSWEEAREGHRGWARGQCISFVHTHTHIAHTHTHTHAHTHIAHTHTHTFSSFVTRSFSTRSASASDGLFLLSPTRCGEVTASTHSYPALFGFTRRASGVDVLGEQSRQERITYRTSFLRAYLRLCP
jgi:hypothetical protein